jgi:hypothetical protein
MSYCTLSGQCQDGILVSSSRLSGWGRRADSWGQSESENASEVVGAGLWTLEREEQQYEAKIAALRAARSL